MTDLWSRPTALYRSFDLDDVLLYVGISFTSGRFSSHSRGSDWWYEAARIDLEHFPNRHAAAAAEERAIRTENPKYNVDYVERKKRRGDFDILVLPETEVWLDIDPGARIESGDLHYVAGEKFGTTALVVMEGDIELGYVTYCSRGQTNFTSFGYQATGAMISDWGTITPSKIAQVDDLTFALNLVVSQAGCTFKYAWRAFSDHLATIESRDNRAAA